MKKFAKKKKTSTEVSSLMFSPTTGIDPLDTAFTPELIREIEMVARIAALLIDKKAKTPAQAVAGALELLNQAARSMVPTLEDRIELEAKINAIEREPVEYSKGIKKITAQTRPQRAENNFKRLIGKLNKAEGKAATPAAIERIIRAKKWKENGFSQYEFEQARQAFEALKKNSKKTLGKKKPSKSAKRMAS